MSGVMLVLPVAYRLPERRDKKEKSIEESES